MGRFVIVGAGIGGLVTALMLGRQGHEVVVCERDASPVPADPDEMWSSWSRPGTPQARLGHTFLAGFRLMLEERLPDVIEDVLSVGAQRWDLALDMPGEERREEDAELVLIMVRRPVMEGVLRRLAEAEETVEIRRGCQVMGLTAETAKTGVPVVTGVGIKGRGLACSRLGDRRRWSHASDRQMVPRDRSERPRPSSQRGAGLRAIRAISACGSASAMTTA